MVDHSPDRLPVVVIGAGPVGLAAAAHLAERSVPFVVLEAGDTPAASVRAWSHIQLFSPWEFNTDPAARRLLAAAGWEEPEASALPTGGDLVKQYLQPLAELPALAPHIRYGAEVTAISRLGVDRLRTADRERTPFVVRLSDGGELLADAVIDASGTWRRPNHVGANGLPAHGEEEAAAWINHGLPDVFGSDRAHHAGRHTVVVGAGHSAANTLLALAELADAEEGTTITWAIRGADPAASFGGGTDDELPARGALGSGLKMLVDTGRVTLAANFRTHTVRRLGDDPARDRVELVSRGADGSERTITADRIVAATGFRPDLGITSELRLELDPIMSAPRALAPLIDPNQHSCGTVTPHGYRELSHPEPGYFTVGMKSYGRAPTFLMLTGYEQVRSIAAALAGDMEAAQSVELQLPETGVCSVTAGGEALALRLGLSQEQHEQLLHATAKHLGTSSSAAEAVLAAATELGIDHTAALQLAAYAAEQFDAPGATGC
ncbi:NAD(P)-binding domain-containing protein [Streptomyces capillispiralis]|uniref:Pyridine nucleotide-disulfide oxidoreductase n=1 Tax=Streptomyces capillispiralis TaxID=68182 RepID=A0A561TAM7_9ACTN|nr:NAD(P)-binding domain-containing protein [Streptomyces capillispiralis]TWF84133.1 pyridine nucleotide-disulfide oxidoreductase [Streptomyces capillispiralis]GHH92972.1 flavoprotein [Streptomyces capillispiralis]